MIKNLTFKIIDVIGQETIYVRIIIKLFIILFSFFLFLFFEDVLEEETVFCCLSFFMTIIVSALFFMSQEQKLIHRFIDYFHNTYLTAKKKGEIEEFKQKFYFRNIKQVIGNLFRDLNIKNGYLGLVAENKILFFHYNFKKVQALKESENPVTDDLVKFLQTSKNYIHSFQEDDTKFKDILKVLKCNCIISLKFKETLVGFLISNHSQRKIFQDIETVKIQEKSILFHNLVIDQINYKNDKFKNEIKKAGISSRFLNRFNIPFIPNIKIELLELSNEFFEAGQDVNGNIYLILTSFENCNQQQNRLIMSYIAGLVFSLQHQTNIEISMIQKLIQDKFTNMEWKSKANILIIEIKPKLTSFKFSILGEKIKVFNNKVFSENSQNESVEEKWIFYCNNRDLLSISQN